MQDAIEVDAEFSAEMIVKVDLDIEGLAKKFNESASKELGKKVTELEKLMLSSWAEINQINSKINRRAVGG
jgi:predicted transglutaminase-like cysteine proteinase